MSILQIVKFCGALIIMLIISIPLCLAILLAGVPTVVWLAIREGWEVLHDQHSSRDMPAQATDLAPLR